MHTKEDIKQFIKKVLTESVAKYSQLIAFGNPTIIKGSQVGNHPHNFTVLVDSDNLQFANSKAKVSLETDSFNNISIKITIVP